MEPACGGPKLAGEKRRPGGGVQSDRPELMVEPWQVLADTLLQREALLCRLGAGVLPHDLAGLYVGEPEVDRILAGLPGLGGAPRDQVGELLHRLTPPVDTARAEFARWLAGTSRFAGIVRRAGLDPADAEVLAVLAAIE